jgi:hypothetical protein
MNVRLHDKVRQMAGRHPTRILVGLLILCVTVSVWVSPRLAVPISTGAAVLGAAVPVARSARPRPPVSDRDMPNGLAGAGPVEERVQRQ